MILTRYDMQEKYGKKGLSTNLLFENTGLIRTYDTFISHKDADTDTAIIVAKCLMQHSGKVVYLDTLDTRAKTESDLGAYLQTVISRGKRLYVVVSDITQKSWWVPYEAGVGQSMRKEGSVLKHAEVYMLPEYLVKWHRVPKDKLCGPCRARIPRWR